VVAMSLNNTHKNYTSVYGMLMKAIEEKDNEAKTKKLTSVDSSKLTTIKDAEIQLAKTLKIKPGDPKSKKINGIAWGTKDHVDRLAYARQDHFLGIFDVAKNIGIAGTKAPWCQCMAMHPTSELVISGGMDNATTLWKRDGGKLIEQTKVICHDGYIASLNFINSGTQWLSAGGDADIRLIDLKAKASIQRFCGHEKDAQSLTLSPDGDGETIFATCSSDKTVKMWDKRVAWGCVSNFESDSELNACSMFPSGQMIAAGGERDKTYVFDVRAHKLANKFARNNQKTASCCWSKSGRTLFVGHDDGAIITWDIFASGENKAYAKKIEAHGQKLAEKDPSACRVQQLKINADGVLASCGFDGMVNIWREPKK